MAFEQISNSFTKEEWLDDVEVPCKIEEGEEKNVGIIQKVAIKGGTSGDVKDGGFLKKEDIEHDQGFKTEDKPLYYSVSLNYDSVPVKDDTLQSSGKEIPYFCHVCDYEADSSDKLIYHVKSHENLPGEPSENLHSGDDANATRSGRVETNTPQNTLACDHCDFISTTLRDMNDHKKTHPTLFACGKCDFKAATKKRLESHMRTHYPKPFACGMCTYRADYRHLLQNHMEKHAKKLCLTKEQGPADPRCLAWKCRQCDYVAVNVSDLTKHMESHQPMGRIQISGEEIEMSEHRTSCKYCKLRCTDKKTLNEHVVNFHNAKPSGLVQLLKSSRISCKGKPKLYCGLCGYGSSQFYLDNHMRKAHNAIVPNRPNKAKKQHQSGLKTSPSVLLTGSGLLK